MLRWGDAWSADAGEASSPTAKSAKSRKQLRVSALQTEPNNNLRCSISRRRHQFVFFPLLHMLPPVCAHFWWSLLLLVLLALLGDRALVGAACDRTNCHNKPLWHCSLTSCPGTLYVFFVRIVCR